METFEQQKAFFEEQWPKMQDALESGGAPAAIQFVSRFEDPTQRRVLFLFAHMGIVNQDWRGKSFDTYIEVCDAGIQAMLGEAEAAEDQEIRDRRTDNANVISANLAADLADCWPGDETPRTRSHFERGLEASNQCITWREQLKKGPWPFSFSYWTKGMHQLSLGDAQGAMESWIASLDYASRVAKEAKKPTTVSTDGDFGVILGSAYVGLARSNREGTVRGSHRGVSGAARR